MKRSLFAAAAAVLLATTAAHAFDGQSLYSDCASGARNQNFCLGYVLGAAEALNSLELYCMPTGVNAGTLKDVVWQWLAQHPAKRTLSGSTVVFSALSDAYPCKKGVK